jgi:hypothetical protein
MAIRRSGDRPAHQVHGDAVRQTGAPPINALTKPIKGGRSVVLATEMNKNWKLSAVQEAAAS